MDTCEHCNHTVKLYNSCSDRHCPQCQALNQAKWIAGRKERILPIGYFHVVFTLPAQLRSVAMCNRKMVFDILFSAAAATLLELGRDKKYLGAALGITAVLHTWTRKLDFHPHVHLVVTGGGLAMDGENWINSKSDFLFPVRVISSLFKGKFLHALARAYSKGELEFAGNCANLSNPNNFNALKNKLYNMIWVVHCKEPFGGPAAVFEYLGRYTHRVAISNERLISINDLEIKFFTKNGNSTTLAPIEFIRRFLMHTLPKGFTKIRHFGILAAGNVNTKLVKAKELLKNNSKEFEKSFDSKVKANEIWLDQQLNNANQEPTSCPKCQKGKMKRNYISSSFGAEVIKRDTS